MGGFGEHSGSRRGGGAGRRAGAGQELPAALRIAASDETAVKVVVDPRLPAA